MFKNVRFVVVATTFLSIEFVFCRYQHVSLMDDDHQFIMVSTSIFLKKWKLKRTLTTLCAWQSACFFSTAEPSKWGLCTSCSDCICLGHMQCIPESRTSHWRCPNDGGCTVRTIHRCERSREAIHSVCCFFEVVSSKHMHKSRQRSRLHNVASTCTRVVSVAGCPR